MPSRIHWPRPTWRLPAIGVTVIVMACGLVSATAESPRDPPAAVETDGADVEHGPAGAVPSFRANDPLAIEAYFPKESYRPGTTARLRFESSLRGVRLQFFHLGPEWGKTVGDREMRGVPVTPPVRLGPIRAGRSARVTIGDWPTGLYFAQLTAAGGRIGYAPFVVPPRRLGRSRVAVVLPTRTWQAYNFRDDDGDGLGDSWYATSRNTARLFRPFLNRGVPPHFRNYDLHFLHWLARSGKRVDVLSQAELEASTNPATLRRAYDVLVFPGHHEYVTESEYDNVEGFRDLGGDLVFLSANNFFWRIDLEDGVMTRVARWRELGRPEASLLGVQFIKNDMGEHRGPWLVRDASATGWLFAGTGARVGRPFSNAGIEIDHTTSSSPAGTQVIAEIPDLLGPGLTAQMAYYETSRGAKVFSAGAFSLAGSIRQKPVAQLLENVWARMTAAAPEPAPSAPGRR